MNTHLAGLIIKRHWKFIVTFFVIVLGSYIFMTNQQVEQWKEQEESFSTGWGRYNYDEMKKNPEDFIGTSYFTKTGLVSFEEYRKQNLEIFQNPNPETEPDNYYTRLVDPVLVMFFLTVSFGLFTFFYDYRTNFNPVIFSSKFSRRRFYWVKTSILAGSFGLIILLSKVIQIVITKSQIPVEFYNASWAQLLPSLLSSTLFYLTMFLASMVIGLVLGELSTAIITVPILIFSLLIFLNSLDTVIGLFSANPEVDVFRAPLSQNIAELSTISINPISWMIVLLLIISVLFLLFSGNYLFNRISLENYGQFLLISKLRFPLLIFLVIYGTFTFSIQGIFFAPSLYSVYMNENSLLYFIQGTLILALLLTIAGYFLLYRDFKFKEIRNALPKKSN